MYLVGSPKRSGSLAKNTFWSLILNPPASRSLRAGCGPGTSRLTDSTPGWLDAQPTVANTARRGVASVPHPDWSNRPPATAPVGNPSVSNPLPSACQPDERTVPAVHQEPEVDRNRFRPDSSSIPGRDLVERIPSRIHLNNSRFDPHRRNGRRKVVGRPPRNHSMAGVERVRPKITGAHRRDREVRGHRRLEKPLSDAVRLLLREGRKTLPGTMCHRVHNQRRIRTETSVVLGDDGLPGLESVGIQRRWLIERHRLQQFSQIESEHLDLHQLDQIVSGTRSDIHKSIPRYRSFR